MFARVGNQVNCPVDVCFLHQRESLAIPLKFRAIDGVSDLPIRPIGAEDWVPCIITAAGLGGELVY